MKDLIISIIATFVIALALFGAAVIIYVSISTAEYATKGVHLTQEIVDKNGKILYAVDEQNRKWRLVR
jgi:membrane carboxypeptidase/penicillin-binding protein PbpC